MPWPRLLCLHLLTTIFALIPAAPYTLTKDIPIPYPYSFLGPKKGFSPMLWYKASNINQNQELAQTKKALEEAKKEIEIVKRHAQYDIAQSKEQAQNSVLAFK